MVVVRYLAADFEQVGQYHSVRDIQDEPSDVDPEVVLITGRSMAVTDEAVDDARASA